MDSPQSVVSPFKIAEPEKQKSDFFGRTTKGIEANRKETDVSSLEKFIGVLEVYVHQARDIQNICIYHKQDVYAKLCLTSDPENTVSTKTINGGGRNPVFNENLRLNVKTVESSLKCEVFMMSRVKNYLEDQLLGFALVPLSEVVITNGKLEKEFSLSSTDLFHSPAGFVQLSLAYAGASPDVMAIPAMPKPLATGSSAQESELSESFDRIEFPDPKIANENEMMISEYFGIPCSNMDSESSESLDTSDAQNQLSCEIGVRIVESFSTATVESVQLPKVDSPPSSVSTNGVSSPSAAASSEYSDAPAVSAKIKQVSGEELQTWREALTEASNLSGWDSSVTRPESRLVDEIVKDVLKKLNDMFASTDFRGLVGIDSRIEKVKSLLCMETLDFRVVGIWGMGGIGKTTIAGAVFNQISCQFDGCCCFVANVREESEKCGGLIHLRDKVLSKILGENINLGTPNIPSIVKRRLQSKKVIVVLDDVNSLKQLEILAGGLDRFGPGSRVIITARDKQLLLNFVAAYNIYKVEALDKREALQLFCNCAFKEDHVPKDFMVFAHRTVDYAKGNPLALKVLGSSLYQKSEQDWESALHKLNNISNPEIDNILRIGYDALDREEKNIFLDIACFFKGEYRDHVMELLNGCYYSAQAGVRVLVDKSLITISISTINMHDLLQEMCWEIVRQESFNNPGEQSRLHRHEDVCQVLRRNSGTEAVEGLLLDMSKITNIDLSSQAFENMCNLRFLKLYDLTQSTEERTNISKVHLPYGLNYLPDKLRYFHWCGYPSKVLPSKLSLDHLVELDLFESNVEQLWEGEQHVPRLKRLILGHSQQLTRIPDLSGSPYLEVIDLVDCRSLLDISSSIQNLKNLNYLRLAGCKSLRSFSRDIHFESVENLDLSSCINLMKFPQISGSIRMLSLKGSEIEEVPSSVESLTNLILLDVSDCSRLKHISINICKVKSLRFLILKNCTKLECFPEILETLEHLETLDLSGTAIKELPLSIEHLNGLLELFLRGCKNLETLPSSISNLASLIKFDLSDCSKLDKLPVNMGNLKSLENLSAGRGVESQLPSSTTSLISLIECLAFRPSSGLSFSLEDLCLNNCNLTEIPEDIGCLSSLKTLELCRNDFESLPTSIKQLSKLEKLLLNDCNMLRSVTVLPVNLFHFEAMNCKQLQSLPNTSEFAEFITSKRNSTRRNIDRATLNFMFTNSPKLNEKAFSNVFAESLHIIKQMAKARKKYHKEVRVSICYPGSKIPEWFCYQSPSSSVNIQLSSHNCSNRKFLGLALCAVIAFEGYCYTEPFSVGVPYVCCFQTHCGDRVTYKGELTFRAGRNYKDIIFINSDHVILGYHGHSHGKLSMGDLASFNAVFNAPEDSSPRIPLSGFSKIENLFRGADTSQSCRLKYCGVCPIYAEPEIIQTSMSDEKFDSTNQDLVPDPQTIPEKKLTLFINNKVVPFYWILHHKAGLWLFYCCIFLVCLFCGLCIFGMLVFLVLELSTRCETYLSSHVHGSKESENRRSY